MLPTFKDRWFWVSVVLLSANVAGGALWWQGSRGRAPTRVLRITPAALASADAPLSVTFSRPMVRAAETGRLKPAPEVKIVPGVELTGLWRSRSTLELRAAGRFALATPYELVIPARLLDAEGYPLAGDAAHRFQTPPLRFSGARQVALSRDWQLTLELSFNDPVAPSDLDRAVRFRDESGSEVKVERLSRGDAARTASFRTDPRRRERVEVAVEAGLRGVSGPLGLEHPARAVLRVESGLGLRGAHGSVAGVGDGSIDLDFGLCVDPQVARSFIRVEPGARYVVERESGGLRLRGDFRPGAAYRVHVGAGLPAEGDRFLPDGAVRSVRMPDLDPRIDFLGEGRFLGEKGSRALVLRSVNLDRFELRAERIFANNLVHHLNGGRHTGTEAQPPRRFAVSASRNEPAFTRVDLDELIGKAGRGPFLITARAVDDSWDRARREVTVTDLGIHVKTSERGFLAWVVSLSAAAPIEGAEVAVLSRRNQTLASGATGAEGLVRLDGPFDEEKGDPFVVTAVTAGDCSYLPLDEARLSIAGLDLGGRAYAETPHEAFVYAERGVIRPGEALHLRAIVRDAAGALPPEGMPVLWEVLRPDDRPAASVPAAVSRYGSCELCWRSEPHHPTGPYTARLRVPGEDGARLGECGFRVEEFLPETLRVAVAAAERRFAGGESMPVRVKAEHLFGGPAKGLLARARLDLVPDDFSHPAWPGVSFTSSSGEFTGSTLEAEAAPLDDSGEAEFRFDLPAGLKARSALRAAVTASVIQVGGRASTTRIAREVDPLPFYLGARQPEGQARPGSVWEVELIAVRPDGTPADLTRVGARALRVTWSHALRQDPGSGAYRWRSERIETQVAAHELSCPGGRGSFAFTPVAGGEYRLRFSAPRGAGEAAVETSVQVYAHGGDGEPGSLEVPGRIALVPDRPCYRVGDVARVMVESPITGLGLLATETDRVCAARVITLGSARATLEVPITADLAPHGYVTLAVVRPGLLGAAARGIPLRAYGAAALRLDPSERAARVEIALPAEARPGAELKLELKVKRDDGGPEDAEVAVALVDAGVLALTGFKTPDPLEFFAAQRALGTQAADTHSLVIPEPGDLLARAPAATGGDGGGGGSLNPIAADRVRPVSIWKGGLRTTGDGSLSLSLPAPDFDGELVAMAVASGRTALGSARGAVRVRRPLVLEPSLPRFLAPGDRCRVPAALHNTTAAEIEARVSVKTAGGLALAQGESDERTQAVPAGGSAVLWFSLEAGAIGRAEAVFACSAPGGEFEKRIELPIRPASPPVTESDSLVVEAGKPVAIAPRADFLQGTLRSELVLSSDVLPTIEGSLRYLLRYPYGCVEQTASTLIPWIALRDALKAMDAEEYTDLEIDDHVRAGVDRLLSMQTGDGGLGFWPGESRSSPYGSLHAALVLLEARAAGHAVPARPLDRLLDYVENMLTNPREDDPGSSALLRAQALSVLARAGRARQGWIETLHERRDELADEGRAHLAVAAALARAPLPDPLLGVRRAAEGGAGAKGSPRDLAGLLRSRPRELCFVLSALVELGEPRESILPVVAALSGVREGGRFRSTHEDGLFLLAMGKAAKLFPPSAGAVRASLKLPGGEARELSVKERLAVPLPSSGGPIGLSVDEGGPLYAFWESRGVPTGPAAEGDHGVAVRRRFLDPDQKPRGEKPFLQGERFLVEIRLAATRSLPNLAVVDALAAGFEIENPALLTADGRGEARGHLRARRSESRDDRLILFCDLPAGESSYLYVARAVTRGRFALPPIAAECMYDSQVHSAHGAGVVEVIER